MKRILRLYYAPSIVGCLLLFSLFLPKNEIQLENAFLSASWNAPLGTTPLGESILTQVLVGAGQTLTLSFAALSVCLTFSLTIGGILFQLPRPLQKAYTFFIDAWLSIPSIFIALSIGYFLPQSFFSVFVALVLSEFAALQKFFVQRLQETQSSDFLTAARVMGASKAHLAAKHILPRLVRDALYLFIITLPSIVLSLASLEFLGVQTGSSTLSLGMQIALYKDYIFLYPTLSLAPVLCILFILFLLNETAKVSRA
ncbi:MAG TPA: ABC transporter permease subunit [Turneriella sp.]|nr:ABC transporter permease subunit [Turneriella sp.]